MWKKKSWVIQTKEIVLLWSNRVQKSPKQIVQTVPTTSQKTKHQCLEVRNKKMKNAKTKVIVRSVYLAL